MKALVLGASGATGKLLVKELLQKNAEVVAILREGSSLAGYLEKVPNVQQNYREVVANVSELSEQDLIPLIEGRDAIFSCLGHNLTLRGMFGEPRRLVSDSIKRVCDAIEQLQPDTKTKIVLMNTTGNCNRDIPEKPPLSQRLVISVARGLLPPHADNEHAADYLRESIAQNHPSIEWVVVRPDCLTNDELASSYEVHTSPTCNVIFDSLPTSRINVAVFMASLASDATLWKTWRGKMPVIYNEG